VSQEEIGSRLSSRKMDHTFVGLMGKEKKETESASRLTTLDQQNFNSKGNGDICYKTKFIGGIPGGGGGGNEPFYGGSK